MQPVASRCALRTLFLLAAVASTGGEATRAAPPAAPSSSPQRAGIRPVWRTAVPLKSIVSMNGYHLLEGRIYAVSSDGVIRCILADTGEHLWTRRAGTEGTIFQPPRPYHTETDHGVAFTRVDDVVMLDLATGVELSHLKLDNAAGAPVVFHDGLAFSCEASSRIRCYDLREGRLRWEVSTTSPLQLPPLYIPSDDSLLFADRGGMIAGARGQDRSRIFIADLGDRAIGWLAADDRAVYAAAADENLLAVDRISGDLLWTHRLPRRPASGPLVTRNFVYVHVLGGGVHALDLRRPDHDWFQPEADTFLAEWNGRAVLLGADRRLLIVSLQDGEILHRLDAGSINVGIANTVNEAVIVGSDRGEVRCFMPVGAERLTLQQFMPADIPSATRPAPAEAPGESAEPAPTEPSEEPPAEAADGAPAEPPTPPPVRRFEDDLLQDPLRSRR